MAGPIIKEIVWISNMGQPNIWYLPDTEVLTKLALAKRNLLSIYIFSAIFNFS